MRRKREARRPPPRDRTARPWYPGRSRILAGPLADPLAAVRPATRRLQSSGSPRQDTYALPRPASRCPAEPPPEPRWRLPTLPGILAPGTPRCGDRARSRAPPGRDHRRRPCMPSACEARVIRAGHDERTRLRLSRIWITRSADLARDSASSRGPLSLSFHPAASARARDQRPGLYGTSSPGSLADRPAPALLLTQPAVRPGPRCPCRGPDGQPRRESWRPRPPGICNLLHSSRPSVAAIPGSRHRVRARQATA